MIDFEKLGEEIATLVHEAVKAATDPLTARIAELEARKVPDAIKGDPGKDGSDGRDGESVTVADVADAVAANFERRFADLYISWERQARDLAEKAINRMPVVKDGKDGADGKDGLDLSHFSAVQEKGGRVVMLTLSDGERTEHVHLHFPVVLDKGFWGDGDFAEPGDGFTFGGSYWIAQKDTDTKPEIGNPDWRLAVKKGRDAKAREVKL